MDSGDLDFKDVKLVISQELGFPGTFLKSSFKLNISLFQSTNSTASAGDLRTQGKGN